VGKEAYGRKAGKYVRWKLMGDDGRKKDKGKWGRKRWRFAYCLLVRLIVTMAGPWLMNVRTCSAEQGPHTLGALHICAKMFYEVKVAYYSVTKNKKNISEQTIV